jgi:CheY-like chemotaxis protein
LAIRELGYNRIIVGITGNALDDDVARFMKAGIDFVFFKPFRDDQLRVLLEYISTHGNTTSEKVKRDLKDLFSKK